MADLETIIQKLELDATGYMNALDQARARAGIFARDTAAQSQQASGLGSAFRGAGSAITAAGTAIGSASTAIGRGLTAVETRFAAVGRAITSFRGIVVGLGVTLVARQIIEYSDAFTQVQNALRITGTETGNLAAQTAELFDIANRTSQPIEAIAQLYQQASLAANDLGISHEQLLRFIESTGQALAVQGVSATQAQGALLQLSQALGSGVVRAQEFNSILQNARPLAEAAARGLDEAGGSVSELRRLIVQGEVSSREFFDAVQRGAPGIAEAFGRSVQTVGQSMTNLRNSLIEVVGGGTQASGASRRLAESINSLADTLRDPVFVQFVSEFFTEFITRINSLVEEVQILIRVFYDLQAAGEAIASGRTADALDRLTASRDAAERIQQINDALALARRRLEGLGEGTPAFEAQTERIAALRKELEQISEAQIEIKIDPRATENRLRELKNDIQSIINELATPTGISEAVEAALKERLAALSAERQALQTALDAFREQGSRQAGLEREPGLRLQQQQAAQLGTLRPQTEFSQQIEGLRDKAREATAAEQARLQPIRETLVALERENELIASGNFTQKQAQAILQAELALRKEIVAQAQAAAEATKGTTLSPAEKARIEVETPIPTLPQGLQQQLAAETARNEALTATKQTFADVIGPIEDEIGLLREVGLAHEQISAILSAQGTLERDLTDAERERLTAAIETRGVLEERRGLATEAEGLQLEIDARGEVTEALRSQLALLEIRSRLGDDAADAVENEVRETEHLRTVLEQTKAARDIDDQLEQLRLIAVFAGRETEEYREQLAILQAKQELGDAYNEQIEERVRALAKEQAAEAGRGRRRDLEQDIEGTRRALRFGGQDTEEFRVQERMAELQEQGVGGKEIADLEPKIRQYERLQTQLELVEDVSDAVAETIAEGFIRGVQEGESFLQILERIGEQLAAMALQAALEASIKAAIGTAVGAAFAGPAIGAQTQYATSTTGAGGAGFAYPMFGGPRQHGGPVDPRQSYMVGEAGPELFIPDTTGAIVPRGGGGQRDQPVIVNSGASITVNDQRALPFAEPVQTSQRTGADGRPVIDLMVSDSISRMHQGGQLDALRRPRGVRRS